MEQISQAKEIPCVTGKGKSEVITIDKSSDDRDKDKSQPAMSQLAVSQPAVSDEEIVLLEFPEDLKKQDQEISNQAEKCETPLPEATCQCSVCQWPKGAEYGDEAIEGDVPPEDLEPPL